MERPELLLQDNPCVPLEVTVAPQGHGCGSQMFRPRRRPTATRIIIIIIIIVIIIIIIITIMKKKKQNRQA